MEIELFVSRHFLLLYFLFFTCLFSLTFLILRIIQNYYDKDEEDSFTTKKENSKKDSSSTSIKNKK